MLLCNMFWFKKSLQIITFVISIIQKILEHYGQQIIFQKDLLTVYVVYCFVGQLPYYSRDTLLTVQSTTRGKIIFDRDSHGHQTHT